jgi:hypothetical protein
MIERTQRAVLESVGWGWVIMVKNEAAQMHLLHALKLPLLRNDKIVLNIKCPGTTRPQRNISIC